MYRELVETLEEAVKTCSSSILREDVEQQNIREGLKENLLYLLEEMWCTSKHYETNSKLFGRISANYLQRSIEEFENSLSSGQKLFEENFLQNLKKPLNLYREHLQELCALPTSKVEAECLQELLNQRFKIITQTRHKLHCKDIGLTVLEPGNLAEHEQRKLLLKNREALFSEQAFLQERFFTKETDNFLVGWHDSIQLAQHRMKHSNTIRTKLLVYMHEPNATWKNWKLSSIRSTDIAKFTQTYSETTSIKFGYIDTTAYTKQNSETLQTALLLIDQRSRNNSYLTLQKALDAACKLEQPATV